MARTRWAARRAALGTCGALLLAACAGGVRMPRIGSHFMPPVVPYASDTLTMSGRHLHRLRAATYDIYAESPTVLPIVDDHLQETAHEFARHFGPAPRVVVLLFDPPASPTRDFDFTSFQQAGTQALAFVRTVSGAHGGALGVDEALLRSRLAELLLAAYADSVVGSTIGVHDATSGRRALDRLPHWFADAVISRVARPEAVDPGLAYVRANRIRLLPLRRLFGIARLGTPPWSELAEHRNVLGVTAAQFAPSTPPPTLLSAESTAFGEFLVDRYGPTFLQAVADELLQGAPSEQVLVRLPNDGDDGAALERHWTEWLARR